MGNRSVLLRERIGGTAATRACADAVAVVRRAQPVTALRWIARLATQLPAMAHSRSLRSADVAWQAHGGRFRTPSGRSVYLPGDYTDGAREMYCRNVYLRSGLTIPQDGWVIDLGANAGLFTTLAAVEGARVVAVEAQQGFATDIDRLLRANRISKDRVHLEIGLVSCADAELPLVGVIADDEQWRTASHAQPDRPPLLSIPAIMSRYTIDRISLLKVDIEGSEFSLLHPDSDLRWLDHVDQITMEVHPPFGASGSLVDILHDHGLSTTVMDNEGRLVPPNAVQVAYIYGKRAR